MSNIVVGTKVEGVWGAMFPTSEGEVIAINRDNVTIQWKDDANLDQQLVDITQIHQPGWTSVNGSPIGIFVDEIAQQAQEDALDAEAAGH